MNLINTRPGFGLIAGIVVAGMACRPAAPGSSAPANAPSHSVSGEPANSSTPPHESANTGNHDQGEATKMEISTTAFDHNGKIPRRYTGDGEDVSPQLAWSTIPSGTRELALICDDPDAPTPQPWVHWLIYKIPESAKGLSEKIAAKETLGDPAGARQGKNSWGTIGYRGPAPPKGAPHHYHFKLYALDTPLTGSAGMTKEQLLAAMKGHILAEAEVVGTYQR